MYEEIYANEIDCRSLKRKRAQDPAPIAVTVSKPMEIAISSDDVEN